MPKATPSTAAPFVPEQGDLGSVRAAAAQCRGCPLWQNATQTVFGEGAARARLMFVGEQPGNEEDLSGHPFVGPAGRLFDQALEEAGIARGDVYLTNAVKHFKWTPQGKRRLHKKPAGHEIRACLPWVEKEIELVRPAIIVCLGATAAQALLGPTIRVTALRGQEVASRFAGHVYVTVHPSSVLRAQTSEDRARQLDQFIADLKTVAAALKRLAR